MTEASKLNKMVQLAEASYALLESVSPGNATQLAATLQTVDLEGRFSEAQARELSQSWSLVHHLPNTSSGFSATLFASKSKPEELALAIRGTEFDRGMVQAALDLGIADLQGIVLTGIAIHQIVDLYNYWKRLTAPEHATVRLAEVVPTLNPLAPGIFIGTGINELLPPYWRVAFSSVPDAGLGRVVGPISSLTVTGHSLGGHLATAFQRLFAQDHAIEVVTVNGMGTGEGAVVGRFFDLLAERQETSFDIARITNLYGSAGPNVATGELLYSQYGDRPELFTENVLGATLGHGIRQMSDSAAVYDLFLRADTSLASGTPLASAAALLDIFKAATSSPGFTLESMVNSLGKIFVPGYMSIEPEFEGDRKELHKRIDSIRQHVAQPGLTVRALVGQAPGELITRAQAANGLAYRYALQELNPFAILGPDVLYIEHNQHSELGLYVNAEETPTGLTTRYIADRAGFLFTKNGANLVDELGAVVPDQVDNWNYVDLTQRIRVTGLGSSPISIRRLAAFGSVGADALQAGPLADRLYGGRGADVLTGGNGNDYLEGGAGMDTYVYSAETSLLAPNRNDGDDELRDTDGRGVLRYTFTATGDQGVSSRVIGGVGIRRTATEWESPDGTFTFQQQFEGLLVGINGDAGGTVRLLDFEYGKAQSTGYMGIRLIDAPSAPNVIARSFIGDKQDWDSDGNAANGVQVQLDAFGNVIRADGQAGRPDLAEPDRSDTLYGGAEDESEKFVTAAGNDVIYGDGASSFTSTFGGRDLIDAGAGRDVVTAGAGDDWVEGGSGGDVLGGNLGNDALYGDSTNGQTLTLAQAIATGETGGQATVAGDLITGDAGNDVIVGSAIADLVYGGEGADVVVGGAGADNIFGDGIVTNATLDWVATRTVTIEADVRNYVLTVPGVVVSNPRDVGSGDVIYGGSGADWVFAGAGDDYVEGGNSAGDANVDDDVVFGEAGADILTGGSGKDFLHGDSASVDAAGLSGDDYLDGGAGDDQLVGYKGDDILIGGDGMDTLDAGDGSDIVWGGRGNDIIIQGVGKDTYIYHRGDGADRVLSPTRFNGGVLALGPDITRADVVLRLGSVIVDLGGGDTIHFESTEPVNLLETPFIDAIHFADGDVMTYAELLAQGFVFEGTEESDTIVGTPVRDRIEGRGGGDRLVGLDGGDSIEGGGGRDAIDGGAGDDTVDGGLDADAIDGAAGNDSLRGSLGDDVVAGGEGDDFISGGAGQDFIDAGAGSDAVSGGSEDDIIRAGADDDDVSAGTGDDNVEGGSGSDSLAGDDGDDSLSGDDGDDSLRGGAGSDVLAGGLGTDTYVYSLGDGADVIHDDGDMDGTDTLVFSGSISIADVSFSRISASDLVAVLADGGKITVRDMYAPDGAGRIEQVRFGDGTVMDAVSLDGLPLHVLLGNEGPDALVGGGFADTLDGRAGDDSLDGGVLGNDTLIGGAGVDTYRLGLQTDQDVVIESGSDNSAVALDPGLSLNDVRAVRNADDLVLGIRGTEHSMTVRDYFALSGEVIVLEAGGQSATAEALLATTAGHAGSREALKQDAWAAARAEFFVNWMQQGLEPVNGTTLAAHHYEPFTASFAQNNQTITTTHTRPDGSSSVSTAQVVLTDWTYLPPFGFVSHTIAELAPQLLASDDSLISVAADASVQVTASQRWVEFDWQVLTSQASTGQRVDIFPFEGGFIKHEYSDNFHTGTAVGSISDAPDDAFESPENELFPRYKLATEGTEKHVFALYEVIAGAGNNTILGAYIADGGSGNDLILAEALALGGDGDDTLSGGAALYGEAGDDRLSSHGLLDGGSGNDVLRGGGILRPGAGNDLMVGESGGTTFVIEALDTGEKVVRDIGSDGGEGGASDPAQWDRLYLPGAATLERLTVWWSALDPLSELGQEIGEPRDTLDLSWGPETTVRIVDGIERVHLGDGTELSIDGLASLAPVSVITGTAGDDELTGTTRADIIRGLGGNDSLAGGRGDDTYLFDDGFGTDVIDDGEGVNRIRFAGSIAPGNTTVTRADEDLVLTAGDDSLRVAGWFADADRRITEVEFADASVWDADMVEAALVTSTEGDDSLDGTAASDVIHGGGGDDTVAGNAGDDWLDGGAGKDTYLFARGDGVDTVADSSAGAEASVIVFGPDVFPWDLRLNLGSLVLEYTESDAIRFTGFDAADPYAEQVFERLEFYDGSVMSYEEVLALGIGITGSDDADVIEGTALNDFIDARAGDDQISGLGGEDNLEGGDGDDTLAGGTGDGDGLAGGDGGDTYVYARGDGLDSVFEWDETPGDVDTLRVLDISSTEIRVTRDEWSYYLVFGETDRLVLDSAARESAAEIERIELAGGTVWTASDLAARIELLPGTALDDALWGTSASETLNGLAGDDLLYGNAGDDLLAGGEGSDFYSFGAGDGADVVDNTDEDDSFDSMYFRDVSSTDAAIIRSGADLLIRIEGSSDQVRVAGWYADGGRQVNEVGFAGDGVFWDAATLEALAVPDSGGLILVGTDARDSLTGQSGDDRLDGAGAADTMVGGAGNDTYVVDIRGDRIVEHEAEGTDAVESAVTYTLAENVEHLLLTGIKAIGGTGNGLQNTLTGNSAANRLDGAAGADTLTGGQGNDTYFLDDSGDVVVELADEGTDKVVATIDYALSEDVENLALAGEAALMASGNSRANVLTGNSAASTLAGGGGNDTYVVDDSRIEVIEAVDEGKDLVKSSVSYALAANVENLTLVGSAAVDGMGNTLDNVLTGNAAANHLFGGQGDDTLKGLDGADWLIGGDGDDTYVVDSAESRVVEISGEGVDTVKSTVSYTLGLELENLTLSGTLGTNGFGNALDNVLKGNSGPNLLEGVAGNDTLAGNLANDVLQGGSGDDRLNDAGGNNLLHGGGGADALTASSGNDLLAGAAGNDTVKTGAGADVIVFNRGDGQDTIAASQGTDNTLSLGGGIVYGDLRFRKTGSTLVLQAGASEQLTLAGWYSAAADQRSIAKLQIVVEAGSDFDRQSTDVLLSSKVQIFDFLELAAAFDAARAANPGLSSWALSGALADAHLAANDTAGFGGDLAYQYGLHGGFAGMSLARVQETLSAAEFGTEAQALFPPIVGGEAGDRLTGGADGDFIGGNRGNDVLRPGAGSNVVAFNAGDGIDTVYFDLGSANTLSFGGGIQYSNLSLSRSESDLVVNAGGEDGVVLKDWYAGVKNLLNLQIVLEASDEFDATSTDVRYGKKIQTFDFLGVVGQFDAALASSPGLTSWEMTNALLQFHLSASDDSALGGDLSYEYGKTGHLGGITHARGQEVIGSAGFGSDAQSLRPFAGLQEGFARLS